MTDPLDLPLRELLALLLNAKTQPSNDAGWVNIRTDDLPWRQLVAAAERGEVLVSRVGRKLLMKRADLDGWLEKQAIGRPTETEKPGKSGNDADVDHLVQRAGYGGRARANS
jgi:hypothetical protein